jgi:hypothetical protein
VKKILISFTCFVAILPVAGCGRNEPIRKTSRPVSEVETAAKPDAQAAAIAGGVSGTVIETMDSAGYTYVQVDTGSEKLWAATPQFQVKVGDQVAFPKEMPMRDYHSQTLDRDFDLVYFVPSIVNSTGGGPAKMPGMPAAHPPIAAPVQIDLTGIEKAEGGQTIGELYAGKADLAGKEVAVRGKVVKFSARIMGKNWLHIRDGSGDAASGTNDLTVTSDVVVKPGDTVLASGTLSVDKDFGAGYKYALIIEDAKVTPP